MASQRHPSSSSTIVNSTQQDHLAVRRNRAVLSLCGRAGFAFALLGLPSLVVWEACRIGAGLRAGAGGAETAAPAHLRSATNRFVELVVVAFREDLAWLDRVVANITPAPRVHLYCKGPAIADPRCQRLENRGTEEYGYLTHILRNYGSLAPVTIFISGNPMNEGYDCIARRSLKYVLTQMHRVAEQAPWSGPPAHGAGRRAPWSGFVALRVAEFDPLFDLWDYHSHEGGEAKSLCRPSASPLGPWYQNVIDYNLSRATCTGHSSSGIFAVSADRVRWYPTSLYERALGEVLRCSSNAFTAGHYMERSWMPMFGDCHREDPLAEAYRLGDCDSEDLLF